MDVSAFSDENFDVKDWINKTFKSAEAKENKDAFASSLVMKLQLYVQQVNSALEDTSQQILASLPRIMRDTEILQQEAVLLREKMHSVKEDIVKVEQDTGQSMATLEHLDRIKNGLQSAKQALHEADNWTVLAGDLEEAFEFGEVEPIATKLVSMQQSLTVLANVADYEERKLQLEGLKNRLEAKASPLLVQAFTAGSVESSCIYVRIFSSIGRLPQLIRYYHNCQRAVLLQQWRLLVEQEDGGVSEWFRQFYDSLLSDWHERLRWCGQVFGHNVAMKIMLSLFADILSELEPSPNKCIDAALKQIADPLIFLLTLMQLTGHFALNLQAAIESSGKTQENDLVASLMKAIYSPFLPYISKYGNYEQQYLILQLSSIQWNKDDLMESIQSLGQSIPRVMSMISDANKRCVQFTEGCGYCGLMKALKVFLNDYMNNYRNTLRLLDHQKGEKEDWALLQMCLTLLQNVGELIGKVTQLNNDMVQNVLEVDRKFQTQESSPFTQYKSLLLNSSGLKEFNTLVLNFQEDEKKSSLETAIANLHKLCSDIHHTTFQVIFGPISLQLEQVQKAPTWNKSNVSVADLPDFSFTPQEYITQIGQYLMTLPQHLEPFLLQDNSSLTLALQIADADFRSLSDMADNGLADTLLGIIARGTCQSYCDSILGICELDSSGCKQLATDIEYLGNVLEDLGLSLTDHMQQIALLLRLTSDEYQSKSSGCAPRLVAAVRQMRNITSSG